MNRNLDGTPLTTEQLEEMAFTALVSRETTEEKARSIIADIVGHGNKNLARSHFTDITKELRMEMFENGELNFRSEIREMPPLPKLTIPEDIRHWLKDTGRL